MNGSFGGGRLAAFAVGLALGLVASAVCLGWWAWQRRRRPGTPTPVAGLALAAAGGTAIALTATTRPAGTLLPGLVVLAVAGAALRAAMISAVGAAARALSVAGAGALVAAGATLTAWSLTADGGALLGLWAAVAICVAGQLLADFDRRRLALAPVLLAVSAAGIYVTVPDVEAAVVVLGAALPIALLGWPGPLGWARRREPPPSLGTAGALATAGLLVWVVAAGGSERPGSIVGGLACLGVLVIEPLAHHLGRLRRGGRRHGPPAPIALRGSHRLAWCALGAQVALVGFAARVVGRPASGPRALLLAALELGVALLAAMAIARLRATRDRPSPDSDEIRSR